MTYSADRYQALAASLPLFLGAIVSFFSVAPATAQSINPIGQVARIMNPKLVETEQRVDWLENRLTSLASYQEQPLKADLGCRAGRFQPNDPDPSVTLDLGAEYPLDSLFLLPAQRESADDPGQFPQQFTIELSNREDFGQRMIVFTAGPNSFPSSEEKLVRFLAHGTPARYVRLTVHKGRQLGTGEVFALSEFIVTSNGNPVSFGAKVTGQGLLTLPGIWAPEYLTDGNTQLGVWQGGDWGGPKRGEAITASSPSDSVTWSIELGESKPLDHIILFPQPVPGSNECNVLPDSINFTIENNGSPPHLIEWKNPLPGTPRTTPLVIPLERKTGSRVLVHSNTPWSMGSIRLHGLSEIEVWSQGKNLAAGRPAIRSHDGTETRIDTLTDGYAGTRRIMPVVNWLNQLHERWRLETQLSSLKPLHSSMVSESELNATWGSAVILGLTFLIPVFIVERRRLINRDHLDSLRKRIASDLHDDIGSNLGSISLIARTARKDLVRLHGPDEVADDLGEVESIARESSLAMRDIVWLLERRADTIGDLIQRMRDTANRLLRDVEYTLECDSCKTAAKLSLDAKRHLFLFYKETIHNVFKHSKATRVSVRLWDKDDKLVLEICDNGVGFDANSPTKPTSVHKLEARGRVLEGQVDVLSIPTKGTSVRLTVKRSHLIAYTPMS